MLHAAVAVADDGGHRGPDDPLARHSALGVKPMSVYHHVANKDEILDGIVDLVFSEIDAADGRRRLAGGDAAAGALGPSRCCGRHPWAIGLLESRTAPGPATLRHHDAIIGDPARGRLLRRADRARLRAARQLHRTASRCRRPACPSTGPETVSDVAEPIMERFATGDYPHMVDMATEYYFRPGYDFGDEFDFGLDLVLDGLERHRSRRG